MANEPPKQSNLFPTLMVGVSAMCIAASGGWWFARRQPALAANSGTEIALLQMRIADLEKAITALETKQLATAQIAQKAAIRAEAQVSHQVAPQVAVQTPASDPALAATLATLVEMQKSQQASLAQLTAKLTQPAAPVPTPTVAPAPTPPAAAPAPATPVSRPAPAPANSLEMAYKTAWETGKPVLVGQVKNLKTGQLEGGRTIDPTTAQSLGLASWQEWYASEEATRRELFQEKAEDELLKSQNALIEAPQ